MKKRNKFILAILFLLAAAVAAYLLWGHKGSSQITYRQEKVDRGDILISISATGTLNAVTTVQVGSQVSGTIARLYADFNSVVKEGELLAQLDPTFLQATVNEQRANVERTRAQVNEAQRNLDRTKQLFEKSLAPQVELDAAATALETAQASLKQTQASLDRAEVNLKYATIRAPISGVVISRDVDVGQTVAASLQAPTIFTIANDLRQMQVKASIDEADIGNVQTGQKVSFRVDAYPDDQFEGVVSQIRLLPEVNQNVVTYTVIIDVSNPEQKLMPGMTANVTIEVAKHENVLRVPILAIRFTPPQSEIGGAEDEPAGATARVRPEGRMPRPEGAPPRTEGANLANRARVWTMEGGRLKAMRMIRGLQNSRYVEVQESELKEGDEVIVGMSGGSQTNNAPTQTQNPLMPRMGGPGRR